MHHSYIWLGGASSAFWILVAFGVAGASVIGSIVEDGGASGAAAARFAATFGGLLLAALVVVAVGVGVGLRALSWRFLWYELDPTELGVYSGVVGKRRTHVPYQKIQSVDLKATLVQRVFGVCNVEIDTAGGASNKAVVIPYLARQDAQALKGELFALKGQGANAQGAQAAGAHLPFAPPTGQPVSVACAPAAPVAGNVLDVGSEAWEHFGGVFGAQAPAEEPASYEYGLTNKEIVLTGISNSGGVVAGLASALVAGAVGLVPLLAAIAEGMPQAADAASSLLAEAAFERALQAALPLLVCGLIGLALFVWAAASLGACLQFGGFRARRRGSRIEVERGLLRHDSTSLDIGRVQSVVVRQSLIRRLIGYCEISLGKVDAAEPGSSQSGGNAKSLAESGFVIHPFVKLDRVDEILRGMVPEYAEMPADAARVAPVALRRGIVRRCILFGAGFWLAIVAAVAQCAVHAVLDAGASSDAAALFALDALAVALYAIAAILFALDVAGTLLWYRDSRFALGGRMVAFTNGGLSKGTVAIPRTKVQFAAARSNPLQRSAGTATIAATTAAGIGGTQTSLVDVATETADAWLSWMEPRA